MANRQLLINRRLLGWVHVWVVEIYGYQSRLHAANSSRTPDLQRIAEHFHLDPGSKKLTTYSLNSCHGIFCSWKSDIWISKHQALESRLTAWWRIGIEVGN